jgi:hypothetical protein
MVIALASSWLRSHPGGSRPAVPAGEVGSDPVGGGHRMRTSIGVEDSFGEAHLRHWRGVELPR